MVISSRMIIRLGLVASLGGVALIPALATPGNPNILIQGKELDGSILKGWVRLQPNGGGFTDGTLHIILENVSKQDVRSRLVAEEVQYHIPYDAQGERLYPFAFGPFGFRPGDRYNVRIHMDSNSDGKKDPGDYYQLGVTVFDGQTQIPPNMIFPTDPIRPF